MKKNRPLSIKRCRSLLRSPYKRGLDKSEIIDLKEEWTLEELTKLVTSDFEENLSEEDRESYRRCIDSIRRAKISAQQNEGNIVIW